MSQARKVVFLDRDGTINVDYGYLHKTEQFELLPGAAQGLRLFQDMGFDLVIITNQSGIGRGMFSVDDYHKFQAHCEEELRKARVSILATYFCPHIDEDNCNCRKPKTGLYEQAVREWEIDLKESIAIGDKLRDVVICETEPQMRGFIVGDNEGTDNDRIKYVKSILEAAEIVRGFSDTDE